MAEENQNPQIIVNMQFVKDLSFEVPNAPQIYVQQESKPQIAVNVDIDAGRLDGNIFQVVLKLEVDARSNNDQVFLIELAYGAIVTLENIPDAQAEPGLLIEVPKMTFPFARRIISDVTRDGGFPPLLLDPIDFVGMYQQRLQMAQAGEGGEAQPN